MNQTSYYQMLVTDAHLYKLLLLCRWLLKCGITMTATIFTDIGELIKLIMAGQSTSHVAGLN